MSGLEKRLISATRKALYEYDLLQDVDHLALALSGGKDSLSLLHLFSQILGRGFAEIPLTAIHVSGAFSCGAGVQEQFLQKTCDDLGVQLIVRETDQSLETLECYSCSRARRKLIFDAAKEVGATTIAFGHHRDDSVETLLLNLLHKGEFAANLPKIEMVQYGVTLIRPLIYIAEADIRRYAEQRGFARITCQCPVGQRSRRRQVKSLLDEMEEIFPNARANLARASRERGSDKALYINPLAGDHFNIASITN
jgi:tRNA 2-thiocytidine biosynthesis protein TtcA